MSRPNGMPRGYGNAEVINGIVAQWIRICGGFWGAPADKPVDIEKLIVSTAGVVRVEERLLEISATWLAKESAFVNIEKLETLLLKAPKGTQAVAAIMLEMAMNSMEQNAKNRLSAVLRSVRPLSKTETLFYLIREYPLAMAKQQRETPSFYKKWGFWYNITKLKPGALTQLDWRLKRCPELRLRALLGPTEEADLLMALRAKDATAKQLARQTGASQVEECLNTLCVRGLVVKGKANTWTLSSFAMALTAETWAGHEDGS